MVKYYEVAHILKILFKNATAIMRELDGGTNQFTMKQFLQTVTQRNQEAYIDLLQQCRKHPSASPFNAAHQHFGKKL